MEILVTHELFAGNISFTLTCNLTKLVLYKMSYLGFVDLYLQEKLIHVFKRDTFMMVIVQILYTSNIIRNRLGLYFDIVRDYARDKL
jgi:hypothetical protein